MSELFNQLSNANIDGTVDKQQIFDEVRGYLAANGYTLIESNCQKPWGAYLKLDNREADAFVDELFYGISPEEARLGNIKAELSPKILLVSPEQRLSWQYHNRRAERWAFLTDGMCKKSLNDEEGQPLDIKAGESVQFAAKERHRLIGRAAMYTLVAEIWQHTDNDNLSDEDDIVRLSDDYKRNETKLS